MAQDSSHNNIACGKTWLVDFALAPSLLAIKTSTNSSWAIRFFELSASGTLRYYNTADGSLWDRAAGTIQISRMGNESGFKNIVFVRQGARDGDYYAIDLRIQKNGTNGVVILGAKSLDDQEKWFRKLTRASLQTAPDQTEPADGADASTSFAASSKSVVQVMSPAAEQDRATLAAAMSGQLAKRGYWTGAWLPRYFVLTPQGDLEYFKSYQESRGGEPKRRLPIAMAPGGFGPEAETRVLDKGLVFHRFLIEVQLRGPGRHRGRSVLLSAGSRGEQEAWVRALR
eukprot:CAMPEP_0113683926 /NCGR_PEP_ID=MMETSP0038_2-20120614/13649_1 /TAXON_ID=2898 /ORGANISM="Cryptomonas paramecium" /LENGTH=284 /DNA_ID=CAMNT_0000603479 /DNA_START=347 /DNA_END=1197 /DNA_ORIENTATION=- /assembly_acc=CAM_ASM_000170